MSTAAPATATSPAGTAAPILDLRLALGLLGVLSAAMMAGLNSRVPGLALPDVRGALGFALDDASWLNTAFAAGELAAMPFATWLSITFSLRRFLLAMLAAALALSIVLPFVQDLNLLIGLRALQGVCSGALIPPLMMSALRFLPLSIRLHGLALYALTATFSPNVALWLAALSVDYLHDWRWIYWHVVPIGLCAMALVAYGIPTMPPALDRLKQGNWLGMAIGIPGLALLVIGLDQGVRLDWGESGLIVASLFVGAVFTALFLISEWRHPGPFMRLQLLQRRNLGVGFSVFLLLVMAMASALPSNLLSALHNFRMEQNASLGLLVGLPQLVLGPAIALLLYRRWIDARYTFAIGLVCIAVSCGYGARITDDWMVTEFAGVAALQMIGQPLAIISLLFLATSMVQPAEGAFVAGIVNTLRALGTLLGSTFSSETLAVRGRYHTEMLLEHAAHTLSHLPSQSPELQGFAASVARQASVLAAADLYRLFAVLAIMLVPVVLRLTYVPAPMAQAPSPLPSPPPASAPTLGASR